MTTGGDRAGDGDPADGGDVDWDGIERERDSFDVVLWRLRTKGERGEGERRR